MSCALAGSLLLVALASYHPGDAGWSTAGDLEPVRNAMGKVGAWLADVLLYLFGVSGYWFAFALLAWVAVDLRTLRESIESGERGGSDRAKRPGDRAAPQAVRLLGCFMILMGSVMLEATRLKLLPALPLVAGGVFGLLLVPTLLTWMGAVGFTLLAFVLLTAGFSMALQFSWLTVVETIGATVETRALQLWVAWQARRDRKYGERATADREEQVSEKRRIFAEDPEPVRIEATVVRVELSARAEAEKQAVLFADLPPASELPALALLDEPGVHKEVVSAETMEFTSRLIEKKLADFGVAAHVVAAYPGPVITRYEIEPATGVKGSQIVNLGKDLARALSLTSIRVVETIPGKSLMGLELPNARRQSVRLSEILSSQVYAQGQSPLTLALGKDIAGHPVIADLARMPHLLVAGTTGSGKSVGINAMLLSLLYKADPSEVRMIMIDPKMLEMSVYEGIPHLLSPVVTDMKQAANALNWCVAEMERRYRLMSRLGVRNLSGFNQRIAEAERRAELIPNPFTLTPDEPEPLGRLPMIVVVIDELADMMMVVGKKVEELIARLAQKARAAGIHLILATQRPSVDVITGLIKANIPTRIAFHVSSRIDSRTILDQQGAEALLGQGDMLFLPPGTGVPQRVHGAFVGDDEVHRVVQHWKSMGEPEYIEGILEATVPESVDAGSAVGFGGLAQTLQEAGVDGESDPLYDQAVAVVLKHKRASISLVQRHLRIGYNRSARLLEQMEKSGIVSGMSGAGNRDILVARRDSDER
jgi:S-DNA-T family DNA segregation ATPase FtsK/SpoIIIE